MKIESPLVCKTYAINPENQAISYIEVLEKIMSQNVPFTMWPFYVIFGCIQEKGEPSVIKTVFEVKNNGKVLGSKESVIDFSRGPKTRLITQMPALTINEAGSLIFSIVYKNKTIGSAQIEIIKVEAAKPKAAHK